MWRKILSKFERYPAQERVVRLILERGFQVKDGKVISGGIEIPHTHIAREVGVDRRVVDAAAHHISHDEELKEIFSRLSSVLFLRDIAPLLGLGVLIITPSDASEVGIVRDVTDVIARYGISVRQVVTDDPYFVESPRLTVITEKKIPGEAIEEILKLKTVRAVSVL
ncbi:amino acid-binding protein [Methanosarcinales archaeon]|nr:MAG: amino acid-binding protein [Methanosarcinales archaeon]